MPKNFDFILHVYLFKFTAEKNFLVSFSICDLNLLDLQTQWTFLFFKRRNDFTFNKREVNFHILIQYKMIIRFRNI